MLVSCDAVVTREASAGCIAEKKGALLTRIPHLQMLGHGVWPGTQMNAAGFGMMPMGAGGCAPDATAWAGLASGGDPMGGETGTSAQRKRKVCRRLKPPRNLLEGNPRTNTPQCTPHLLLSLPLKGISCDVCISAPLFLTAVWPLEQDRADTNGLWAQLDSMIPPVHGTPRPFPAAFG